MAALGERTLKAYAAFERLILFVLLGLLMLVILWATGMFVVEIVGTLAGRALGGPAVQAVDLKEFLGRMGILRDTFGAFMLLLIGLELMKTIAMYLERHELHVEVVFSVALIAVARHAIDLDFAHTQPLNVVGLGVVIIALSAGYFLFRKALAVNLNAGREEGTEGHRS